MSNEAEDLACPELAEYVAQLRGDTRNKRYKAGCLSEFVRFAQGRRGSFDPRQATRELLMLYGRNVAAQAIAPSTRTTKLRLVIAWFAWMAQTGRLPENPADGLSPESLLPGK